MPYETIELERRGGAATIRLNRPEAMNAWNRRLGEELFEAVREVAADDAVRAVCITGAGGSAARSRWPATCSSPTSPPTCCWPSSTSA